MANRYWVGGSGTWDASTTTNWSTTSGGSGGASVPGSTDVAIFDASSGGGTCTLGATVTVGFLTMTNYTGTLAFSTYVINLAGDAPGVFSGGTGYTLTGTKQLNCTYNGANARSIVGGSPAEANTPNVKIQAGSGAFNISGRVNDLDFSGFAGSLNTNSFNVYGSLILSATMTVTATANGISFNSTSAGKTITTNGVTLDRAIGFDGAGGSWAFQDNLTQGSTRAMTLTNGTLNGNNKNVAIGTFALGSGTKTLTLGSGTWTVAGATWNANTNVANLTVSASTGTISMTSGSAKTFSGGAKVWPTLNQGGAGTLTIAQSNTFTDITNTTKGATLTLTAGTTQTVSAFSFAGTSASQTSLNSSSAGSLATLNGTGGIVNARYLNIKDVRAQGYTEWNALLDQGAVDQGNTPGWNFITLGIKKILRKVFSRQIIRPVIEEIQ